MPVDRPPRTPSPKITPQIATAILNWIAKNVHGGLVGIVERYLEEEVHPDDVSAVVDVEERYGMNAGDLLRRYVEALTELAERVTGGWPVDPQTALNATSSGDKARPFLRCLPEPEFLTALEISAQTAVSNTGQPAGLLVYLDRVFHARGLPYTASVGQGIRYVGEPTVREHAIEPALAALANPLLVDARAEFEDALAYLRRGEFKNAGRWAGDAVETTMAVLLENWGHPQPQTEHGTDLVQATKLFDQLKSKDVRALNEDRDKELIFAPMKVRNACGHGAGANPTPADPAHVEAGVAAAAIAITYLASKFK
jgi:hypothetical protein